MVVGDDAVVQRQAALLTPDPATVRVARQRTADPVLPNGGVPQRDRPGGVDTAAASDGQRAITRWALIIGGDRRARLYTVAANDAVLDADSGVVVEVRRRRNLDPAADGDDAGNVDERGRARSRHPAGDRHPSDRDDRLGRRQ